MKDKILLDPLPKYKDARDFIDQIVEIYFSLAS